MDVREWVIILAIVFMVVLALDAWRRVRRQHRYQGSYTRARSPLTAGQTRRHPDSRPRMERSEPGFADAEADSAEVQVRRVEAEAEDAAPVTSGQEPEDDRAEPGLTDSAADSLTARDPEPEYAATGSGAMPEPEPDTAPEPTRRSAPPPSEPSTRPGEKVPMLVDSVDTPEEDGESPDEAENQYEFDLKTAARSAQNTEPSWQEPLYFGAGDDSSSGRASGTEPSGDYGDRPEDREERSPEAAQDPFLRARERLAADADATREESPEPRRRFSDPEASPFADLYADLDSEATAWEVDHASTGPIKPTSVEEDDVWDEPEEIDDPALNAAEERQLADDEASEQLLSEPEEVLVMTVLAQEGHDFDGTSLLQIMLACGMRFGRMNIFHATDDEGRLQYSAANAFNPGTFDLDNVEHFATRGVTFFLQLPCQSDPMEAFDAMYQSATVLATNLHGDIHDDNRSIMTAQTLTHYRERIRDFQRSQLVKRA